MTTHKLPDLPESRSHSLVSSPLAHAHGTYLWLVITWQRWPLGSNYCRLCHIICTWRFLCRVLRAAPLSRASMLPSQGSSLSPSSLPLTARNRHLAIFPLQHGIFNYGGFSVFLLSQNSLPWGVSWFTFSSQQLSWYLTQRRSITATLW